MLEEDKESNLLEMFRLFANNSLSSICLIPNSETVVAIVDILRDERIWETEWIDSSSKDAPPPDFYNDRKRIMMEVMRVDDHAYEHEGKIINPTAIRARTIEKELQESGVLDLNPNARININSPTDLPSLEDHNYRYYKTNFRRIIEKHKKQIARYRINHPGYKLVFFVFDESSMYCKTDTPNRTIKKGEPFLSVPHIWFSDKAFTEIFKNSEIDYLVWFTPYKQFICSNPTIKLPLVCVFDCNQEGYEPIDYPEDYMVSTEE